MDSETFSRLRPADHSAAAIRDALAAVEVERTDATHRAGALTAERARLLLVGTTGAIARTEAAIREIATDLEQLAAIADALLPMLRAAEERESGVAHAQQVREAAEAIEKFNDWLANAYAAHAVPKFGGSYIGLEKRAIALRERLRDRHTGAVPEGLPPLALAHVGSDGRSLSFLVRLPSVAPGTEPPAWRR